MEYVPLLSSASYMSASKNHIGNEKCNCTTCRKTTRIEAELKNKKGKYTAPPPASPTGVVSEELLSFNTPQKRSRKGKENKNSEENLTSFIREYSTNKVHTPIIMKNELKEKIEFVFFFSFFFFCYLLQSFT
jgi:hypothetical protein